MIVREDRGDIVVLRMERGKVNALDPELLQALADAAGGLREALPRAVVLTGSGRNFSAGLDLVRLLDGGADYRARLLPLLHEVILSLFTLPRPVVAAVNGHAIAGGFVLACACDYRLVARSGARLGVTELPVGVPFPAAPLEMVRTVLGTGRAREVVYSGRLFSPEEGARVGFADELVEPADLLDRAVEVAARWGAAPHAAFALTKAQLQAPVVERLREHAAAVDEEVAAVWGHPDTGGAIRAFIDRTLGGRGDDGRVAAPS